MRLSKEKRLIEDLAGVFKSYQNSKLKKGKTIIIQVVDKSEGWTQTQKMKFRKLKDAQEYLEDLRKKTDRGK